MHGLIGRALETFIADAHGDALRGEALSRAGLPPDGFASARRFSSASGSLLLRAASAATGLPSAALLTDLGIWLVSQRRNEPIRRLVRFGGGDFHGFLHSLEDLPARGRLAMPDLDLPRIMLIDRAPSYDIRTEFPQWGAGHVLSGVLRGMADDYGVLAVVEHAGGHRVRGGPCAERIRVEVADDAHTDGRRFDLVPSLLHAA